MSISGIYSIRNKLNGKRYVGQSFNIKGRISTHKSELKYSKHCCSNLQRTWNKNKEESFEFVILEEVDFSFYIGTVSLKEQKKILTKKEQFWTDLYKSNDRRFGYNRKICVDSNKGIKHSEEERKRNSERQKGLQAGEKNPRAKLSNKQRKELIKDYCLGKFTNIELALKYNIGISRIPQIVREDVSYEKRKEVEKINRSRASAGQNNPRAKMNQQKSNRLRELWNTKKYKKKDLANIFNISEIQVYRIVHNKVWKELD